MARYLVAGAVSIRHFQRVHGCIDASGYVRVTLFNEFMTSQGEHTDSRFITVIRAVPLVAVRWR